MPWVFNPHSGGVKVPESLKEPTRRRILAHAERHYAGRYARLDIRFKGAPCYIDAYMEPKTRGRPWTATGETREQFVERLRSTPTHLCRLRHSGAIGGASPSARTATNATSRRSSRRASSTGRPRRASTWARSIWTRELASDFLRRALGLLNAEAESATSAVAHHYRRHLSRCRPDPTSCATSSQSAQVPLRVMS